MLLLGISFYEIHKKRTRSNNQLVTMFTTILNCTSEEIKVDNTYKMNVVSRSKPLISRSKMR